MMARRLLLAAVAVLAALSQLAAADWPHFRGPTRDGHTSESSGYSEGRWLPDSPAWKASVGRGSTTPLVVDGRLYTLGWNNGQDRLVCLDLKTGQELWKQQYRAPERGRHATGDESWYGGPTGTPEFDMATGHIYTLGNDGQLQCWNTRANGKLIWSKNLYDTYRVPQRPKVGRAGRRDYGYTSSPLVWNDWLIVEVGSPDALFIAFDKSNGDEVWRSQLGGFAGHNSGPVPITIDGKPCVATLSLDRVAVVRLDAGHEGETYSEFPWETDFANNIASLAVHKNSILVTSAYNRYALARLDAEGGELKEAWSQPFPSKICTPVVHKDAILVAWSTLFALDWKTGERVWSIGRTGDAGSCLVTSDEKLIVWAKDGDLYLFDIADPRREPRELARRSGMFRTDVFPHVVLANGHLVLKDKAGNLQCFPLNK